MMRAGRSRFSQAEGEIYRRVEGVVRLRVILTEETTVKFSRTKKKK